MDKLLSMVMNGFLRQLVKLGITHGVNLAAGKGKPEAEMTAEERSKAKGYRDMAKQAQEVQKMARRFMK